MSKDRDLPSTATSGSVDAFLRKVAAMPARPAGGPRGRLLFAMDATQSRERSWDRAAQIQGEMFLATEALGGLSVQLAHYRGFREFEASPWVADAKALLARMTGVSCRAGETQVVRVLEHAIAETRREKVAALVFVGDAMEENPDRVCQRAGELGLLGVPAFVFQEGGDPVARRTFEEIARLTRGAYCPFDSSSAQQLKDLLAAVAVYAAGGRRALADLGRRAGGAAALLTHRLGGGT